MILKSTEDGRHVLLREVLNRKLFRFGKALFVLSEHILNHSAKIEIEGVLFLDDTIRKVVSWACVIIILVAIVLGMLLPWLLMTYGPTLFPEKDLSGCESTLQTSSIVISFASAFLGAYSIYQAAASSKETKLLLERVNELNSYQQEMNKTVKTVENMLKAEVHVVDAQFPPGGWKPDKGDAE